MTVPQYLMMGIDVSDVHMGQPKFAAGTIKVSAYRLTEVWLTFSRKIQISPNEINKLSPQNNSRSTISTARSVATVLC